jgi:hypothetical protein
MVEMTRLNIVAPILQSMARDPSAGFFYDLISGALVWRDEFPLVGDSDAIALVRYLLRFRTSVIIGQPDVQLEPYWQEAAKLCPDWPGFAADRISSALAPVYHALAHKGNAQLQSFFDSHPD